MTLTYSHIFVAPSSTLPRAGCPKGTNRLVTTNPHNFFLPAVPSHPRLEGPLGEKMDPAPTEPFNSSSPLSNPRGRTEAAATPRRLRTSPPGRHARITDVPAPNTE